MTDKETYQLAVYVASEGGLVSHELLQKLYGSEFWSCKILSWEWLEKEPQPVKMIQVIEALVAMMADATMNETLESYRRALQRPDNSDVLGANLNVPQVFLAKRLSLSRSAANRRIFEHCLKNLRQISSELKLGEEHENKAREVIKAHISELNSRSRRILKTYVYRFSGNREDRMQILDGIKKGLVEQRKWGCEFKAWLDCDVNSLPHRCCFQPNDMKIKDLRRLLSLGSIYRDDAPAPNENSEIL